MIYTSYYSRWQKVPNPVGISIGIPQWYPEVVYDEIAPSWELVRGIKNKQISEEEYTAGYIKLLKDRLVVPAGVYKQFNGCTFLCWEGPNKFCHRHIVSKWLRDHGFDSKEYVIGG